jgi:hypothetical protein
MVPVPPLGHVPAPVDPKTAELCERYNALEQQVMQLAAQYRQAPPDGEERTKLHQQITELTGEQFQLRHEYRQLEVERLQKRLAELEFKLQRRQERREDIVKQRVAQLTDGDDELRWEPLVPAGSPLAGNAWFEHVVPHGHAGPAAVQQLFGHAGQVLPVPAAPAHPVPPPQPPTLSGLLIPRPPGSTLPPQTQPAASAPVAAAPSAPAVPAAPAVPDEPGQAAAAAAPSVAEAKARCEIAQRELERAKQLVDQGLAQAMELERAEDAVRLSRIMLQNAQREHKLRIKMMELDVRRVESELAGLQAELAEAESLREKNADEVAEARLRKVQASVAQKQYDVERARAILESEQHQNEPEAEEGANTRGR